MDDEEEMVKTLAERLSFRGIGADWVTSGFEALTCVGKKDYDIVVLDVKMPGMSGLETLDEILRINPEMKVIFVTGHGSVSDCEAGREAGACFYLMKPIDIEVLIEKIVEILNS